MDPQQSRIWNPKILMGIIGIVLILGVAAFFLGNITLTGGAGEPSASSGDSLSRTYLWTYNGDAWSWTGTFPTETYLTYQNRSHSRGGGYPGYALSGSNRVVLQEILQKFQGVGLGRNYSDYDVIMNIVAFVQSLPRSPHSENAGYDNYPKYPLETLVDQGGDSEDTAVLTAALLQELGYGVVLLQYPDHVAVGVKGDTNLTGTYFVFQDSRYYYLETAGQNWKPGEIPDAYRNLTATILPLEEAPEMKMTCSTKPTGSDAAYTYYQVHCEIRNEGEGPARNVSLSVAALALIRGEGQIWPPESTITLGNYPAWVEGVGDASVRVPKSQMSKTRTILTGDNFDPVILESATFRA